MPDNQITHQNVGLLPATKQKLVKLVELGKFGTQLNAIDVLVDRELQRIRRKQHRQQKTSALI